ncbi:unnamed protein product [Leuciscus chuanchicus]
MCGTSCMLSGIQVQGAEQAEWWGTGSLTELTRLSRHQARQARLRRNEVQSARQLKKANSKSKHNALLFTAAKTRVC